MFFSIVKDPVVSGIELNHYLNIVLKWAHQWKLEFYSDARKQETGIIFSFKKNKANHPQLSFNGSTVVEVKDQNIQVLHLLQSFSKQIHKKNSKAKKNIGIIKHISKYLP